MTLDNNWFTEIHADIGSAFSLQLKEKVFSQQSEYQLVEVYDTVGFGKFMVIESGSTQPFVIQLKAERLDQVEGEAGIGAEADDVAGVGGDLRLIEHHVEHLSTLPAHDYGLRKRAAR